MKGTAATKKNSTRPGTLPFMLPFQPIKLVRTPFYALARSLHHWQALAVALAVALALAPAHRHWQEDQRHPVTRRALHPF